MTDTTVTLVLDVLITQEAEHPAFRAAAQQLSHWLTAASGVDHTIKLKLRKNITLKALPIEPGVIIISLFGEVGARHVVFTDIAAHWRQKIPALMATARRPVFLCTIFRHVPILPDMSDEKSRAWMLERIRRLNLLAIELSQATGVGVIDIDRTLAHFGAKPLQTDHLLTGQIGAEAAGEVIVSALLAAGLDEFVRLEWLQKAQQLHGGLRGLAQRLRRHLAQS